MTFAMVGCAAGLHGSCGAARWKARGAFHRAAGEFPSGGADRIDVQAGLSTVGRRGHQASRRAVEERAGYIDLYACSAVVVPPLDARELLTELDHAHLVSEHTPGRFRFHDLLRAYATELTQQLDTGEHRESVRQFAEYYLRGAVLADRAIQPCRDGEVRAPQSGGEAELPEIVTYAEGMRWFNSECATLLMMITLAAEYDLAGLTWRLAWACTTFLRRSGRWHERADVHRIALAVARRSDDVEGQATALRHLGPALARLGQAERALDLLREAAQLFESLGDGAGSVATHLGFTRVLESQGRHLDAFKYSHRAWRMVRNSDDLLGQADNLDRDGQATLSAGEAARGAALVRARARALHGHGPLGGAGRRADQPG